MDKWKHLAPDFGWLILQNERFIVFITRERCEVHWETSNEHDAWMEKRGIDESDCQSRISYLESLPCEHLGANLRRAFRCQLGEAMVCVFRGKVADGIKVLERAQGFLTARNQEYARRQYVLWTGAMSFVVAAATTVFLGIHWWRGWPWDIWPIFDVGVGGSLGAFLFTVTRMERTLIDPDAQTLSHVVEAMARGLVGLIVSVAAVCAVKGAFLFPQQIKDNYGLFLLCVAAGASERFGGAIIEHFDHMLPKMGMKLKSKPQLKQKQ